VADAMASATAYGRWFWSPGYCKHQLQTYGIEIDDGRTFNISKAFCIGRGGRECEWNRRYTARDYRSFISIVRSYDGNIRMFTLWVTGRDDLRVSGIRLVGFQRYAYRFNVYGQQLANGLARREHEKGCMPYQGQ
jgi:hypothetical protein